MPESYLCAMFYKWLFFLYLLPLGLLAQTSQVVQLYQENKLWGIKTEAPITPAVYDTLIRISNTNKFIAKKHGKGANATGVISAKGKIIIPFSYWQITPSGNYYIVCNQEHNLVTQGVITSANKVVLNLRFKNVKAFNNKWYAKTFASKLQLFDKDGNLIKTINADSVIVIENTPYLKIYKQGKVGLLNSQGNEIFKPEFKQLKNIDGQWKTTRFAKWQIISKRDTATIFTDSVIIWDKNYTINSINNNYFITNRAKQTGGNYNNIKITSPNFAITKKDRLYGVINKAGKEILAPSFGKLYYCKGYFYSKNNNFWSVYDSLGRKKSIFTYDSIGIISNGLFPIKRKGKWGFMNRNGKEVVHCIYDSKASFKNGKAITNYFGAYGIIDLKGNWIVKPKSAKITDFSYNFYIYKKAQIYYLSNYNNELIYFTSNKLVFKNESIFEIKDGYTNRITSLGTRTENARTKTNGSSTWQIIKVGDKYGFEDQEGVLKITYRYDSLLLFSEDLAAFKLRENWGFIDVNETIEIQPIFSAIVPFKNHISIISKNGKIGLLRIDGSYLLKPKFESITNISKELWLVKKNGFEGIYNSRGHIIIQPIFEQVIYVKNDLIIVIKNEKYGVVNDKGQSVIPRIYDYIGFDKEHNLLITKGNPY